MLELSQPLQQGLGLRFKHRLRDIAVSLQIDLQRSLGKPLMIVEQQPSHPLQIVANHVQVAQNEPCLKIIPKFVIGIIEQRRGHSL